MLSSKTKDRPMLLTSHRVQSAVLKSKIQEIPVEKQTDEQKRFLAEVAIEEKGIITARDVQEFRQAPQVVPLPIPKEFVKAPANKPTVAKKVESGKPKTKKRK